LEELPATDKADAPKGVKVLIEAKIAEEFVKKTPWLRTVAAPVSGALVFIGAMLTPNDAFNDMTNHPQFIWMEEQSRMRHEIWMSQIERDKFKELSEKERLRPNELSETEKLDLNFLSQKYFLDRRGNVIQKVNVTVNWNKAGQRQDLAVGDILRTEVKDDEDSKERVKWLMGQIRKKGFTTRLEVIEIDGETYLLNGHHRLIAAKKLGLKTVPVRYITVGEFKNRILEMERLGMSTYRNPKGVKAAGNSVKNIPDKIDD